MKSLLEFLFFAHYPHASSAATGGCLEEHREPYFFGRLERSLF
jgi:hypothetical protein